MVEAVDVCIVVIVVLMVLLFIASTHLLIEKRNYASLSKQYNRRVQALSRTKMALLAIETNGVVTDYPFGMRCKHCNANGDDSNKVAHSAVCPVGIAMRTRQAVDAA